MRRLVEDQGARVGSQLAQPRTPRCDLRRQKTLEYEAIGGQASDAEGCDCGARTRYGAHLMPRASHGLHDPISGVADQWRPGIRDESDALAGIECGQNLRYTLRLVVLMR